MSDVKHWVEVIAEEVLRRRGEPYVIASGITTSGFVHLGTLCEFLYPSAINEYLRDRGHKTRFIFIGDVMDAFDSVPAPLQRFRFLRGELGKPLCKVPDPFDCCPSYGEHFLRQTMQIMERFEVKPEILRADELYEAGKYDSYARLFIERLSEVTTLLEKISMRKLPKGWLDIILPICDSCGKIATTTVKGFEGNVILYACEKELSYAKGCGYRGETRLEDHKYKLQWRLDWPSRQDFLEVSVEGAGADHHTRGGSWDTAVAIHERLFKKSPPVGFKYGFLLFKGKKYSKSTGLGLGVKELLDLVPPALIKYFLFKQDVEENKEFDPTGEKLMRLFDDYSIASSLTEKRRLTRAEQKALLAYELAGRKRWKADFTDVLMNYQILGDWKAVGQKVGDVEGVRYLKLYIENWIKGDYVPDEFVFEYAPKEVEEMAEEVMLFAQRLREGMSALDIHNLVYEVATSQKVKPAELFKALYKSLIGKEYGPRFGKLVFALGVEKVKKELLEAYS